MSDEEQTTEDGMTEVMQAALQTYDEICHAEEVQEAVGELSATDLARLDLYLSTLPESGIPGVVQLAVQVEQADRWRRLNKQEYQAI